MGYMISNRFRLTACAMEAILARVCLKISYTIPSIDWSSSYLLKWTFGGYTQWIGLTKGKSTGNLHISWKNPWFPVDSPFNQTIDRWIFHYKPSILGYPHCRKPSNGHLDTPCPLIDHHHHHHHQHHRHHHHHHPYWNGHLGDIPPFSMNGTRRISVSAPIAIDAPCLAASLFRGHPLRPPRWGLEKKGVSLSIFRVDEGNKTI